MNQPWIYMCSPSRSFTVVLGVPLFSCLAVGFPAIIMKGLFKAFQTIWHPVKEGLFPTRLTVHEILQGRLLEWVAISFSRESSWPRNQTRVPCISCIAGGFFTTKTPGKLCTLGRISQMVVVQSLSHVWLFATPWTSARQASLSLTISWSLLKFMFIELVMPWALKINNVSVIFPCLWRSGNWNTHLQWPFFFFFWYFIDYLYCMCEGLAGIYSYLLGTRVVSGS